MVNNENGERFNLSLLAHLVQNQDDVFRRVEDETEEDEEDTVVTTVRGLWRSE